MNLLGLFLAGATSRFESIEMFNQNLRDAVGSILRNPVIDVFNNLKLIGS